jgi:copper chaperone
MSRGVATWGRQRQKSKTVGREDSVQRTQTLNSFLMAQRLIHILTIRKDKTMKLIAIFIASGLMGIGCSKTPEQNQAHVETVSIKVETAQCGSCVKTITEALKQVEGVQKAEVDIKTKVASVTFLPMKTNLATLEEAITKAGYDANDKKRDPEAYRKLDECCKTE